MASKTAQRRHICRHRYRKMMDYCEFLGGRMPNIVAREQLMRQGVPMSFITAYERYYARRQQRNQEV